MQETNAAPPQQPDQEPRRPLTFMGNVILTIKLILIGGALTALLWLADSCKR